MNRSGWAEQIEPRICLFEGAGENNDSNDDQPCSSNRYCEFSTDQLHESEA